MVYPEGHVRRCKVLRFQVAMRSVDDYIKKQSRPARPPGERHGSYFGVFTSNFSLPYVELLRHCGTLCNTFILCARSLLHRQPLKSILLTWEMRAEKRTVKGAAWCTAYLTHPAGLRLLFCHQPKGRPLLGHLTSHTGAVYRSTLGGVLFVDVPRFILPVPDRKSVV